MNTTDSKTPPGRTPGIVLLAAILNFVSAALFAAIALACALLLTLGGISGVARQMSDAVTQAYQQMNLSYGLHFLMGAALVGCALLAAFFVWLGVALLRARKWAWFAQVTLSVIGLLNFPVGTVLNAVILVFFFRDPVRQHHQV